MKNEARKNMSKSILYFLPSILIGQPRKVEAFDPFSLFMFRATSRVVGHAVYV